MNLRFRGLPLVAAAALAVIACIFGFSGDNGPRPPAKDYARPATHAIADGANTPIGKTLQAAIRAHPGLSGFHLVTNGHSALMLRLDMIAAAERSLDLQYYSLQADVTGKLLIEALLRAAARGVRVRILIDDITLKKSDPVWRVLIARPGIEMRLFNPLATYSQSLFGRFRDFLSGLGRFDRRMHNKLFIADNQLSIVGGRNLGDAYFDNDPAFDFRDVDVLAAGPLTQQASDNFDRYWNGNEAYPLNALIAPQADPGTVARARQNLTLHWQQELSKGDIAVDAPLTRQLESGRLPLIWAQGILAADYPDKIDSSKSVLNSKPAIEVDALMRSAQQEFIAIASYFVPSDQEMEWLKALHARGASVRILTNSLASTDVVAVSVGYSRIREKVVANGAELYELKPVPGRYPRSGRFASASRASLHSKIYVVDKKDIVVGTYNFDPRSTLLNTEIDLIIHSPALASQLEQLFDHIIAPAYSFHVILAPAGAARPVLEWITEENGTKAVYSSDPNAGFWRNVEAGMLSVLPWGNQL